MGKHKSDDKKKKKKSSQLVIRIDTAERDAFVKLCDTLDTSAAREIRKFMRDWVAAHAPQPDAVEPATAETTASAADVAPAAPAPEAPSTEGSPVEEKPAPKARRKRTTEVPA